MRRRVRLSRWFAWGALVALAAVALPSASAGTMEACAPGGAACVGQYAYSYGDPACRVPEARQERVNYARASAAGAAGEVEGWDSCDAHRWGQKTEMERSHGVRAQARASDAKAGASWSSETKERDGVASTDCALRGEAAAPSSAPAKAKAPCPAPPPNPGWGRLPP